MRDAYRTRLVKVGPEFSELYYCFGWYEYFDYQKHPKDYCTFQSDRIQNWWGDRGDRVLVGIDVGPRVQSSVAEEICADWPGLTYGIEKAVFHQKPLQGNAKYASTNGMTCNTTSGQIGKYVEYRKGWNVEDVLVNGHSVWVTSRYGDNEEDYHFSGSKRTIVSVDSERKQCEYDYYTYDGYVKKGETWSVAKLNEAEYRYYGRRTANCSDLIPQGHADLPEQLSKFGEFTDVKDGNWPKAEGDEDPVIGWAYQIRREADTSFATKMKNPLHRAYSQAVGNVPKANSNSYQNIAAAYAAIKGVYNVVCGCADGRTIAAARKAGKSVVEYAKDVKNAITQGSTRAARKAARKSWDTMSNAWLTNRYVIATTKMDLEEYGAYILRESSKGDAATSYGTIVEDGVTYRCKVVFHPEKLASMGPLEKWWEYGFANPRYAVWDSIPFSFMVDWFIPIGDQLEAKDNSFFLTPYNLGLESVTYSCRYKSEGISCDYEIYTRWPGRAFEDVIPVGTTSDGSTSISMKDSYQQRENTRTAKRVIDSAAIFL